jgi:hypothetical protein
VWLASSYILVTIGVGFVPWAYLIVPERLRLDPGRLCPSLSAEKLERWWWWWLWWWWWWWWWWSVLRISEGCQVVWLESIKERVPGFGVEPVAWHRAPPDWKEGDTTSDRSIIGWVPAQKSGLDCCFKIVASSLGAFIQRKHTSRPVSKKSRIQSILSITCYRNMSYQNTGMGYRDPAYTVRSLKTRVHNKLDSCIRVSLNIHLDR